MCFFKCRKLPPVVWAILVLAFCLALYITVSPSASIANSVPPNKVNLENKPGSASGGELPGGDVELPGAGGELPGGDGKLPDDVGELPGGGEGVAPAIEKPKNIDGDSPDTVLGAGEGEGEKAPSEDAGGEESKGVDEGGEGEHQEEVVHGKSTPDPCVVVILIDLLFPFSCTSVSDVCVVVLLAALPCLFLKMKLNLKRLYVAVVIVGQH